MVIVADLLTGASENCSYPSTATIPSQSVYVPEDVGVPVICPEEIFNPGGIDPPATWIVILLLHASGLTLGINENATPTLPE